MSVMGHERPGRAGSGSGHVRARSDSILARFRLIHGFLNQYSAPVRNLEKNFFARELKIVLQHNPPKATIGHENAIRR